MDSNMMAVEKTTIKDFFATFASFFSTNKTTTESIDKKLQKVYEVEKEIGATKGIGALEKFVTTYSSPTKSARTKTIIKTGSNGVENKQKDVEKTDNGNKDLEIVD